MNQSMEVYKSTILLMFPSSFHPCLQITGVALSDAFLGFNEFGEKQVSLYADFRSYGFKCSYKCMCLNMISYIFGFIYIYIYINNTTAYRSHISHIAPDVFGYLNVTLMKLYVNKNVAMS